MVEVRRVAGLNDQSGATGLRSQLSVSFVYRYCFKPKNSAAVPPSKLTISFLVKPSRVCSIETVLGEVPSGCGKSLPIISRELPMRLTTSARVESSERNE